MYLAAVLGFANISASYPHSVYLIIALSSWDHLWHLRFGLAAEFGVGVKIDLAAQTQKFKSKAYQQFSLHSKSKLLSGSSGPHCTTRSASLTCSWCKTCWLQKYILSDNVLLNNHTSQWLIIYHLKLHRLSIPSSLKKRVNISYSEQFRGTITVWTDSVMFH